MLKIKKLNQYDGESHTRWGEQAPFVQWTNADLRTPGRDAGLEYGYRDVSSLTISQGVLSC